MANKRKNYVVIVRDHSGSMQGLAVKAAADYNANVRALKQASQDEGQDTIVSVIECGATIASLVRRAITNSSVQSLQELAGGAYHADGYSTPLFDSVGSAIDLLKRVPDYDDPEVSFLVMAVTDGQDNNSPAWGYKIGAEISALQATDRWTFAFRVPKGYAGELTKRGVPAGNILEWEQTERGMERATVQTQSAISGYYAARSAGQTCSTAFYTDLAGVSPKTVAAKCRDVSREIVVLHTFSTNEGEGIRSFVERQTGKPMLKGAAFYELTKVEKKVQDYKQIVIMDRKTGACYSGAEARNLLGIPHHGDVKLVPGNHAGYAVFIQSTSVNRKLRAGTRVLYWERIGVPFTEGPSAPRGKKGKR